MFDFDSTKLIAIGILALIVIGPKELPGVLRQVGQYVAKMRRMAGEFQQQFSDAMRESELQELKKDMEKMAQDAKTDLNYDMVKETEREIREAIDNSGKDNSGKDGSDKLAGAATASEIRNPTPDDDPDGAFAEIDIPKPDATLAEPKFAAPMEAPVHPPVREVGLETEPAEAAPKARRA